MAEPRLTGADQSENFCACANRTPRMRMDDAKTKNRLNPGRVIFFFVSISFLLFVFAARRLKRAVGHRFVTRNQSSTNCFAASFPFSLRVKRRTFGIKS